MKLFIVLSVIACGYAAKLDRTYLPPASAATAGGSPGSLTAPGAFGQASNFGAPSGSGFPASAPGFQKTGQSFGQNAIDQPASSSNQYQQPASGFPNAGSQEIDTAFGFPDGAQAKPERAQASADRNAEILRYENENDGNTFAYSFETSNGISAEESGVATNGVQAQGGFAYTGDDGEVYRVTYTADENGYQPQGDHLPTSPPIPDEILRSIEENARAAAAGTQEGAYQPDASEAGSSPQQYSGSPSFNQEQSPSQSYNQPQGSQGPAQQYGAPNAASGPSGSSGPSSGSFNQAQSGPKNQITGSNAFRQPSAAGSSNGYDYSAPSTSGRGPQGSQFGPSGNAAPFGFTRQDQSSAQSRPSQQYGAPSGSNQPFQQYSTPASNCGSTQGPSQQVGAPAASRGSAPSTASAPGSNQASQYNAPAASSQGSNQSPSQQYGAPASSSRGSNQHNAPAPPGRSSQPSQQYTPQGSSQGPQRFGSVNNAAPGSPFSVSRQDQSSAQSRPQGIRGQAQDDNGYQYNRPQGAPFGQSPSDRSQSAQYQNQATSGPQFNKPAQSAFSRPGQSSQGVAPSGSFTQGPSGSFGPTTGPAAALVSQSLLPGSRTNQGSRPQSTFGPSATTQNGSNQYRPGQSAPKDSMLQSAPYQYNRPGASPNNQGSQPSQSAFSPATPTFGGPRQPPSFNSETGYTY